MAGYRVKPAGKAKKRETVSEKKARSRRGTGYIKDDGTGEWKVINPAGSLGYNYLYGNVWDWLD